MHVLSWWYFLCAVAALNVAAWVLAATMLRQRRSAMGESSYVTSRRQVILAAGYVFGCAFRSALPVFDVPRQVMFDTWLSSIIVGRSVATIAELCFVAQWALLLRDAARDTGSVYLKSVSSIIFPLIVIAEICSWYSVLTTSNLGHVVEESLWGISATLVAISLAAFAPRCPPNWRPALVFGVIVGSVYAAYMFLVDVPMYWDRWMADQTLGREYLSVSQGVADALERRIVSRDWKDWRGEAVWMSMYFSVAVWISISLAVTAMRKLGRRVRLQPNASEACPAEAAPTFLDQSSGAGFATARVALADAAGFRAFAPTSLQRLLSAARVDRVDVIDLALRAVMIEIEDSIAASVQVDVLQVTMINLDFNERGVRGETPSDRAWECCAAAQPSIVRRLKPFIR